MPFACEYCVCRLRRRFFGNSFKVKWRSLPRMPSLSLSLSLSPYAFTVARIGQKPPVKLRNRFVFGIRFLLLFFFGCWRFSFLVAAKIFHRYQPKSFTIPGTRIVPCRTWATALTPSATSLLSSRRSAQEIILIGHLIFRNGLRTTAVEWTIKC